MTAFGIMSSSEEHGPRELVELAASAEEAGFQFASISDHFDPWMREQGHGPFVSRVPGAIASSTERLEVGIDVSHHGDIRRAARLRQEVRQRRLRPSLFPPDRTGSGDV